MLSQYIYCMNVVSLQLIYHNTISRWNFTVSQVQLLMIEGEDDNDFSFQQDQNQLNLHVSDGARMLYLTKRYD